VTPLIDLLFPVRGDVLPTDHGYALYGAFSRIVPRFHAAGAEFRFAPIAGDPVVPGILRLNSGSRLRLRLPQGRIRDALPLAGKRLDVDGHLIRLGVPAVAAIFPAAAVWARLVTFKHAEGPDQFLTTARRKLTELEVGGEPAIPVVEAGPRAGEYRRRVVRLKGRTIIGYALEVSGLSDGDSLRLQELGLGGRTRMGCGFFLPKKEGE
jgi:CRISPR-associated protein Cas6